MDKQQIERVEVNIAVAKKGVAKANALEGLYTSPAFKEVILKGYLKDEAQRLVLLKADPAMQTEEHQKRLIKGIDAIGYLDQYFRSTFTIGEMAEKALKDDEETRVELLNANEG